MDLVYIRWYLVFDDFCVCGIVVFELIEHAVVATPEQPNVGHVVEDHGPSLQAQAERPTNVVLCSSF